MADLRIKKIEIRNFRSIEKMEIDTDKGINVFTGKNDAGKSNILKALNLFFNNEVDIGDPFDYERDYRKQSKKRPDRDAQHRPLKIVLYFEWKGRNIVWGKTYLLNPEYAKMYTIKTDYIYYSEGKKSLQTNTFNLFKNIKYRYVPAIRDRKYTNHLLEELYKVLEENSRTEIVGAGGAFVKQIENEIKGLTEELDERLGLKSKLSLPTNFAFLFGKLDIHTIKKIPPNKELDILLQQKGDGIQNRYITQILASLTRIDDKRTIWGVEEPENNLEIGTAQEVAHNFSNYIFNSFAKLHQIFLTTHSPVFYGLANANSFFISQDEQGKTSCKKMTKENEEEMGLLPQIVKILEENKQQAEENDRLKKEISKHNQMLIVEGTHDKDIFEIAIKLFCPAFADRMNVLGAGGCKEIAKICHDLTNKDKKIMVIYDGDARRDFQNVASSFQKSSNIKFCLLGESGSDQFFEKTFITRNLEDMYKFDQKTRLEFEDKGFKRQDKKKKAYADYISEQNEEEQKKILIKFEPWAKKIEKYFSASSS